MLKMLNKKINRKDKRNPLVIFRQWKKSVEKSVSYIIFIYVYMEARDDI